MYQTRPHPMEGRVSSRLTRHLNNSKSKIACPMGRKCFQNLKKILSDSMVILVQQKLPNCYQKHHLDKIVSSQPHTQLVRNANTQNTLLSNSGPGPSKLCINKPCRFSSLRTTGLGEIASFRNRIICQSSPTLLKYLCVTKDNKEKDIIQSLFLSLCPIEILFQTATMPQGNLMGPCCRVSP